MATSPECIVIGLVILSIFGAYQFYNISNPYGPGQIAKNNLSSSYEVSVQTTDEEIVFKPRQSDYDTGIILYSDSYVEPGAYSPIAMQLAKEGFLVVLTIAQNNRFFLSAVFKSSFKLSQFIQANEFTKVKNWFIGGHGKAGKQVLEEAREYIDSMPKIAKNLKGLILMAGQPITHSKKTGKKSSKTVVTNFTLQKNNLCSLYFSYDRSADYGPVSIQYEKGAIYQLPSKYRRVIQTEESYYQFADYQLNKNPEFRSITQHCVKFINECLDPTSWVTQDEDIAPKKKKKKNNKQDDEEQDVEQYYEDQEEDDL